MLSHFDALRESKQGNMINEEAFAKISIIAVPKIV